MGEYEQEIYSDTTNNKQTNKQQTNKQTNKKKTFFGETVSTQITNINFLLFQLDLIVFLKNQPE